MFKCDYIGHTHLRVQSRTLISNVELKIVVVNEPATTCDPDGKVKVGSPQSVSGHSMLSPCNITSGLTSQFISV